MAWEDNITQAAYTSPSGLVFTASFEDLSKEIEKKTTAFNFPDVDGTYVQDLGKKGRRYPMRWIFWGEEYDQDAEAFDDAIEEKGRGILQHPLYGTFDVIPFGTIKRRDDLVSAANQAVYDIVFYETIDIVFPVSELAAENAMEEGFSEASTTTAENYEDSLSVDTAQETTGFIDSAKAGLRKIKKEMAGIAATTAEIERQFNDVANLAEETISTLVGGPLLIATQLIALTRLPSQTAASIQSKLEAYGNLLSSLTIGPANQFFQGLDSQAGNAFSNNNMIAKAALIASIESTISPGPENDPIFTTRTQILEAQENLDTKLTDYITWSDENRERLVFDALPTREPGTNDLIDTGESYQKLLDVFSISQGRLTEIAFTALQERSVIIDRDRTFIDFCAEYYGELDPKYDFVIQTCNLTGWEIVNGIAKGREMVYYV
jgi:hypothetical protein